jgi:hypothetical protein
MSENRAFVRGVLLGASIASTVALCFCVYEVGFYEGMYKDMASGPLPWLTKLVLGSSWRFGAPLAAAGAATALGYRRPASVLPYIAVLVATLIAIAVTWYGIRLPIWQLAGNIE